MDKRHILDEIKRAAKENDGVPLGTARFLQETGIAESDWRGKYWARWGDAVREAGFNPNELQGPLDEDLLIKKYIALVRELGRFPVNIELRMKRINDPSFPSHNVFSTQLGTKRQLLSRIGDYCRTHEGFEDIQEFLPNSDDSRISRVRDDDSDDFEIGYVYLIRSGRFHKIGRRNAVGRREYELAIQLPEKAKTIHVIKTDDPAGIESYWHQRFAAKRKNGEWFELDSLDVRAVRAFKRRKFM